MKIDMDKIGPYMGIVMFALFFGCMFAAMFVDLIAHFDIAPASGTTTGYISYQERGGIYKLDFVCWRDTPYSECETFDSGGKNYPPGRYVMSYECSTFVWAWEHPNECRIVNATKIGEITDLPQ
jgi:hypothetical protein